ncbi:MAG: NAD(P)-dependent oxidoreductase [Sphingomonadaceae bacterium]|nr:NAD(P)-dependent oxidoreductase [Sphingomonadaceae bacterium]
MAERHDVALIGFGEAGMAFAGGWRAAAVAYDIKTDDPALAAAKRADYARCGVTGAASLAEALDGAPLIVSVVTADQALAAAEAAARTIAPGALYCDFNSVAPQTKQAAARAIEAAGGLYADVAVMAPVHPAGLAVPLLVSGADACSALAALGFRPRRIEGPVGRASTIKMLRSVMVKGIEALTAECFLAARQAGVADEVAASLDASWPGAGWATRADYNLGRMRAHGLRRAAEMEEVAATLEGLGQGGEMARATAIVQRRLGTSEIRASEAA